MIPTELIGFLAAGLTTIAFLPQVLQVWRSRSAKDISLGMYLLFSTGVFLWIVYGLFIVSWPIIIANTFTLVFALLILIMKFKFDD